MAAISRLSKCYSQDSSNHQQQIEKRLLYIWREVDLGHISTFPHSFSASSLAGHSIVKSDKVALLFLKIIGNGCSKIVCEALECHRDESSKRVAVWIPNPHSTRAEMSIQKEVAVLERYAFSRFVSPPSSLFYTSDMTLVAVAKLYEGDAFSFIQGLNKKSQETFSHRDFQDILFLLLDLQFAAYYAYFKRDILYDIKPENILVDHQEDLTRFVICDLAMCQPIEAAKKRWEGAIKPRLAELQGIFKDRVVANLKPPLTINRYQEQAAKMGQAARESTIVMLKQIDVWRATVGFEGGSHQYMPPEEWQFGLATSGKDCYAIGRIFHMVETWIPPFRGELERLGLHTLFMDLVIGLCDKNQKKRLSIQQSLDKFCFELIPKVPLEMGLEKLVGAQLELFSEIINSDAYRSMTGQRPPSNPRERLDKGR